MVPGVITMRQSRCGAGVPCQQQDSRHGWQVGTARRDRDCGDLRGPGTAKPAVSDTFGEPQITQGGRDPFQGTALPSSLVALPRGTRGKSTQQLPWDVLWAQGKVRLEVASGAAWCSREVQTEDKA